MDKQKLWELQRNIARLSGSEEEARNITQLLKKTNWGQVFQMDTEICDECLKVTPYHELKLIGPDRKKKKYCPECTNGTCAASCTGCGCVFDTPIINKGMLCAPCKLRICALCYAPTLGSWPRAYRSVVCQSCLVRRNLTGDWMKKEVIRISTNQARTRSLKEDWCISFREWLATLEYFDWKCAYCQNKPYQVLEHFIPVKRCGGDTIRKNCIPACKGCNDAKGHKHPSKVTTIPMVDLERVKHYLDSL